MRKTFLVVGVSRYGLALVKQLAELDATVIGIDINGDELASAEQYLSSAFVCDARNKVALEEVGVNKKHIDHAIITIGGKLDATILTFMNLNELGIPRISVRVDDDRSRQVLERIGATEFITPETSAALTYASQIISDNMFEHTRISDKYSITEIKINEFFKGVQLVELNARNKYGVNIVAIVRNKETIIPTGETIIHAKDKIYVIGTASRISKLESVLNKEKK